MHDGFAGVDGAHLGEAASAVVGDQVGVSRGVLAGEQAAGDGSAQMWSRSTRPAPLRPETRLPM